MAAQMGAAGPGGKMPMMMDDQMMAAITSN